MEIFRQVSGNRLQKDKLEILGQACLFSEE